MLDYFRKSCARQAAYLLFILTFFGATFSARAYVTEWDGNKFILYGDLGQNGANGQPPDTSAGQDGLSGESINSTLRGTRTDAIAGSGGFGGGGNPAGNGGPGGDAYITGIEDIRAWGGDGGDGGFFGGSSGSTDNGHGGEGGIATAKVDHIGVAQSSYLKEATAYGGSGGWSGRQNGLGRGGNGGFANAEVHTETNTGLINTIDAIATAYGGHGGQGRIGGDGGTTTAEASGISDPPEGQSGATVYVNAHARGGNGGTSTVYYDPTTGNSAQGGIGGNGSNVGMYSNVDGYSSNNGQIFFSQTAVGGNAGHGTARIDGSSAGYTHSVPGDAGQADSSLTWTSSKGEAWAVGNIDATGGNGGDSVGTSESTPGGYGNTFVSMAADDLNPEVDITVNASALGGNGGNNITLLGDSGTAGNGGNAFSFAYSTTINGNSESDSIARGGSGGNATLNENGHAGNGGNATALASAITLTGSAHAHAIAYTGQIGAGGISGNAIYGDARVTASAKAGDVEVTKVGELIGVSGWVEKSVSLPAPVAGLGQLPNSFGILTVDSSTNHTLSSESGGTITIDHYDVAEITASGGYHSITSPIVFSSDTTINTPLTTDTLGITSPTIPAGSTLTKAGGGSVLALGDLDLSQSGVRLLIDATTFSSTNFQIGAFGDLTIAETLTIDLIDGFEPMIGDSFDILLYGNTLTGVFDTVEFPNVDGLTFGIEYNINTISYHSVLEGDLDNDGYVGVGDLTLVLNNWNQSVDAGVLLQGDLNGDGYIGIDDKSVILGNWNAGTPPVSGIVVPEPATWALLALGSLIIVRLE